MELKLVLYASLVLASLGSFASRSLGDTPLVNYSDSWRYRKGLPASGAPQATWKTMADASLDGTWLPGNGGFGYADNAPETALCQTILGDMRNNYTTVYIRKSFEISSPVDTNSHLNLTVDFDDGFIAWLDGNSLTSQNWPGAPAEPAFNATAPTTHESSRGNNGQPALTVDLGAVGSRLGVGTHVLALMALNQDLDSSDLILIADLFLATAPTNPPSNGSIVGGTFVTDATWYLTNSPYTVTSTVTVANGATLTIEPGVTVQVNQGLNLNINGRLLAEGNATNRIRFTRAAATGTWGGINVNGIAGSPETRFTYVTFEFNGNTAIHGTAATLLLDHVVFTATAEQYLSLDGSSFVVSDCIFPSATALFENVHGNGGIKSSGRGTFVRNFFGVANSVNGNYNDVLDFTGGNRPEPIIHFFNNVFIGSDDDLLDLDGTDAWIEGNIFLHTHRNGSPDSASAISGGNDGSRTSRITIIGNIMYDCDQAATGKQGNFYTLLNNTIVRQTRQGGIDTDSGVVNFADDGTAEGAGMYLEGNIIYDAENLTRNLTTAMVTFTNNLMPFVWTGPGGANSTNDPMFKHVPQLSETMFTNWADAQIMRDWLSLLSGSPAIGAGPNGRDLGGVIPLGASISGQPSGTTALRTAVLTVGIVRTGSGIPSAGWPNGSGYTHYQWRLDGGPWSAERPIATPITLSSLADGAHYVEVVGKLDSGLYQNDSAFAEAAVVTRSPTWTVSHVPVLEIIRTEPGSVELHFRAEANTSYTIESRTSLSTGSWQLRTQLDPLPTAHDVTFSDSTPAGTPRRFYRLAK